VPALLAEAVEQSLAVSRDSDGAFDVTVSPLVRAWGFGAGAVEGGVPPTPADLDRLSETVGYRKLALRMQPPALRKSLPALEIDLDGIAPGLAVDRIADRLEALGIRDYLVELGGEVRARGRSAAGRPWRVAVRCRSRNSVDPMRWSNSMTSACPPQATTGTSGTSPDGASRTPSTRVPPLR